MNDITTPASITLEMHGITHTVENLPWDSDAQTLKKAFECLMVGAGFSPNVIEYEDGHYEWVED